MMEHTQVTSEEDVPAGPHARIDTSAQAFRVAARHAHAPAHEWMIGLCLDRTMQLIGIHHVFCSPTCRECPDEAFDALLEAVRRDHPHHVLTVRYHTHPWRGPRTPGMKRLRAFRQRVEAEGVSLLDAIIGDSTGYVFSLCGESISVPFAYHEVAYALGLLALLSCMGNFLGNL